MGCLQSRPQVEPLPLPERPPKAPLPEATTTHTTPLFELSTTTQVKEPLPGANVPPVLMRPAGQRMTVKPPSRRGSIDELDEEDDEEVVDITDDFASHSFTVRHARSSLNHHDVSSFSSHSSISRMSGTNEAEQWRHEFATTTSPSKKRRSKRPSRRSTGVRTARLSMHPLVPHGLVRALSDNLLVEAAHAAAVASFQASRRKSLPTLERSAHADDGTSAKMTAEVVVGTTAEGRKHINEYLIMGDIARGSYGRVMLCVCAKDKKLYAIKSIKRGEHDGVILREIAIMKKLRHRNVVRLWEVMDDEQVNELFLVMEHMVGGPVMTTAQQSDMSPISAPLLRPHLRDILCGLDYLHFNHVVHRDLKPENLLLDQHGVVKISDFGLANMRSDATGRHAEASAERWMMTTIAGSPSFTAPELCGERVVPVDGRAADLWALGVSLFVLCYGQMPFRAPSAVQLFAAISHEELSCPPETQSGGAVDARLVGLLHRLLEKSPPQRASLAECFVNGWVTNDGAEPLLSIAQEQGAAKVEVSHDEIHSALAKVLAPFARLRAVNQRLASAMANVRPMRRSELHRTHWKPRFACPAVAASAASAGCDTRRSLPAGAATAATTAGSFTRLSLPTAKSAAGSSHPGAEQAEPPSVQHLAAEDARYRQLRFASRVQHVGTKIKARMARLSGRLGGLPQLSENAAVPNEPGPAEQRQGPKGPAARAAIAEVTVAATGPSAHTANTANSAESRASLEKSQPLASLRAQGLVDATASELSALRLFSDCASAPRTAGVASEDAMLNDLALRLPQGPEGARLFAVFDGHGGDACARFCQQHAGEHVQRHLQPGPGPAGSAAGPPARDAERALRSGLLGLDEAFLSAAVAAHAPNDGTASSRAAADELNGRWRSGSTATALLLMPGLGLLSWAHLGDSEAILALESGAPVLLTVPHKPGERDERARIRSAVGWVQMSSNGLGRVNGHLAVSRALGDFEYKVLGRQRMRGIDQSHIDADLISNEPAVASVALSPRFHFAILASDGLWDLVSKATAQDMVRRWLAARGDDRSAGISGVAQLLVDEARKRGSADDVSVIVVEFRWGSRETG